MKSNTWMPFYIGDYLRDTSRLTTSGHGGYILLIIDYWATGKPLPDDDRQLAAITRCTASEWKKLRPILAQFFVVGDGIWRHKRIDAELAKATGIIEKRSNAGKASAAARAQREANTCSTHVDVSLEQNARPSPSPTSSLRSEVSGTDVPGGSPPPKAPDPMKDLWNRGTAFVGRSLLGKMIQKFGQVVVLGAIVECESECPADAPAYFVACCERRKSNGSRRSHAEQINDLGEWARRTDERESLRGDYEAAD